MAHSKPFSRARSLATRTASSSTNADATRRQTKRNASSPNSGASKAATRATSSNVSEGSTARHSAGEGNARARMAAHAHTAMTRTSFSSVSDTHGVTRTGWIASNGSTNARSTAAGYTAAGQD